MIYFSVEMKAANATNADLSGCSLIKGGQQLEFSLEEKRRLYAFEVKTNESSWNQDAMLEGIEATARWETVKIDKREESRDSSGVRVLFLLHRDGLSKRYETLMFTPLSDVTVCGVKLFLYYDQCGKPTQLLNGQVSYDDYNATYLCDDGYHVTGTRSQSAKRKCFQGEWTNPVPTCKFTPILLEPPKIYHKCH